MGLGRSWARAIVLTGTMALEGSAVDHSNGVGNMQYLAMSYVTHII